MIKHKTKQLYLDITSPNSEDNYYLINKKNNIIGEISAQAFKKHPEHYMTDEITPITYTGLRKRKKNKIKTKRTKKNCKCK